MKVNTLFLAMFMSLSLLSCGQQQEATTEKEKVVQGKIEILSPESFLFIMGKEDMQLIDVRTEGEVAEGFIPGALNMDILQKNRFEIMVGELDKSKPVMVYCKVGGRSSKAAKYLIDQGFTAVYDLQGGYVAWADAGYETVKP